MPKKKLFFLYFIFWLRLITRICESMITDGFHNQIDYENLAKENSIYNAACYIAEYKSSIAQTGVLIAPNLIATAAHGIVSILKAHNIEPSEQPISFPHLEITFKVKDSVITYKSSTVLVDVRYIENRGLELKYDIALIRLSQPVFDIVPAQTFKSAGLSPQSILTVITFGTIDLKGFPNTPLTLRAFQLYERDRYFENQEEESLNLKSSILQSSIFFKPNTTLVKPDYNTDEVTSRVYEATQNWLKDEKKPYGLALPGTSGSPIFVKLEDQGKQKIFLFGIVTGYATLSGSFRTYLGKTEYDYLLKRPDQAFNAYQTIFALFYCQDNNPLSYESDRVIYSLDSNFSKLIKKIEQ